MKSVFLIPLLLTLTLASHKIVSWNSRLLVPLNEAEPATALLNSFFGEEGRSNVTTLEYDQSERTFQIVISDGVQQFFTKQIVLLIKCESESPSSQKYEVVTIVEDDLSHLKIIEKEVESGNGSQPRTFRKQYLKSESPFTLRYISQQKLFLKSMELELEITMEEAPISDYFQGIQDFHFYICCIGVINSVLIATYAIAASGLKLPSFVSFAASDLKLQSFFSFATITGVLNFKELTLLWDLFGREKYFSIGMSMGSKISFLFMLAGLITAIYILFDLTDLKNNKDVVFTHFCALLILSYDLNPVTMLAYTLIHIYSLPLKANNNREEKNDVLVWCRLFSAIMVVIQLLLLKNLAEITPNGITYIFEEVSIKKVEISFMVVLLTCLNAVLSLDFVVDAIKRYSTAWYRKKAGREKREQEISAIKVMQASKFANQEQLPSEKEMRPEV